MKKIGKHRGESNGEFIIHKFKNAQNMHQVSLIIVIKCQSENYRRRQWHPTPVLLPGKSHGWRSLVGCSPWGR